MIQRHLFRQNSAYRYSALAFLLVLAGSLISFYLVFNHQENWLLLAPGLAIGLIGLIGIIRYKAKIFSLALFLLLFGYAFLGKSFAYIRIGSVFIGELVLVTGILALLVSLRFTAIKNNIGLAFQKPEIKILLLLMTWGMLRTIPNLPYFGMDAIRDAVIWGYAVFALLILALFPIQYQRNFLKFFQYLMPLWMVWMLTAFIARNAFNIEIPLPNNPIGLFDFRSADMGMYLAAIGAFLLLRLDISHGRKMPTWLVWLSWVLWLADFGIVFSQSRGSFLGSLSGIVLPGIYGLKRIDWRPPVILAFVVLIALLAINPVYNFPNAKREISVQQYVENFTSLININDSGSLTNTVNWRLNMWRSLVEQVSSPELFWQGHGFGFNLPAKYADTATNKDNPLRSPHDIFISFLGFSGFPGLFLWCLFLVFLARRFFKIIITHGLSNSKSRLALWYLIFILSFIIIGSFGNLIETPFSGIWFWVVIGFGLLFSYSSPVPTAQTSVQR